LLLGPGQIGCNGIVVLGLEELAALPVVGVAGVLCIEVALNAVPDIGADERLMVPT